MLKEGQVLEGKYKIGRILGKGGMGAVFLGTNTRINRTVAIKVLHDVDPDSENARRFEREAQAAGSIGSDHIVEVLDLGTTPDGDRFMVMEFLDGESLKTRLARGRLQPAEVVPLGMQILEGLAAAHAAGIVHRDLKPDNVFILKEKAGRRDFVKIVDFGISKFAALGGEGGGLTKTGAVMGTPYYMSPEQARAANEADHRSDLYSVGVLLYESVTSSVPFHATTFTELLFKIVFESAPHPCSIVPDLDPAFASIILKAMARNADDRYQTAAEFSAALASWAPSSRAAAAPHPIAQVAAPPVASPGTIALSGGTAMLEPLAASHAFPAPPAPPPPAAPGFPQATQLVPAPPLPLGPGTVALPLPPAPAVLPLPPSAAALPLPPASAAQPLAPAPPPSKSRMWLVAPAAIVVLGIGAAALFMLGRPASGAAGSASASAATAPASAIVSASPSTPAPSTATSSTPAPDTAAPEPPSAAPAMPSSAPSFKPGGAKTLPSAKPRTTPSGSSGKLADPGY